MVATVPCVDKVTLLGPQTQARLRAHDIICYHTMVGYLFSTDNYFRNVNGAGFKGTESHFGVGGKWGSDTLRGLDGKIWQWQDLDFTADANYQGVNRVISIETADNAPRYAKDIEPWTPKQLEANIRLGVDLCRKYNIPPVLIPDTKPGRRGIGYHQQGVDPWRVTGGEKWSTSYGKECPTNRRIHQLKTIVIPEIARRLNAVLPPPIPLPEEDDVSQVFIDTEEWTPFLIVPKDGKTATLHLGLGNRGAGPVDIYLSYAGNPSPDVYNGAPKYVGSREFKGWNPDINGRFAVPAGTQIVNIKVIGLKGRKLAVSLTR